MALEIFKLVGSIMVDNTKANESLSKTDEKAHSFGKTLASGLGTAAKWGAGIVAAAGAGAAALYGVATNAASAMDVIDKGSAKIGISKTAYQEWSYVLGQNGMDISKLEVGMKSLVSAMDGAASGSASQQEKFSALGLSIYDVNGNLKDQETMLRETLFALADMENGTEKARLATELFGKAGVEMMPMLNGGSEGMADLTERAHELGLVVSDEAVTAGVVLGDTMDDVKQSFGMIISKIGVEVMPIIQLLLDWILAHMPEIQAVVQVCFDAIKIVIGVVADAITWLAGVFDQYMPAIQAIVQTAFTEIKAFWDSYLKPCLEAIGQFIQEVLAPAFEVVFNTIILPVVEAAFNMIGELWEGTLKPVLTGITEFLTGVISGDFEQAFQGIVTVVGGIFNGLISVVKAPVNAVIGIVNNFIRGLNKLKIPDWVPIVGGKGINIPTIPTLERGGILERGQVGFLEGNGAEAVVPLEKNKKWIAAVAQDMDTALGGGGETTQILIAILTLLDKISKMSVVLDTGAMVGGLAGPMDKKLGQIQAQKARA